MNMTRNGKIARLPQWAREQLNRRLEDGEQGKSLVEWLNGLPEVQETLKWQFNGRPISEQNLSEWRQGGYQDWFRHQESRAVVRRLAEEAEDFEGDAGGKAVSDRLSAHLALRLVGLTETLLDEASDSQERWLRLRELLHELGQLRRHDHRAARLQMDQERWERELEHHHQEEMERERQETTKQARAPILAALSVGPLAKFFGGGKAGWDAAAHLMEINYDLEPGTLSRRPAPVNGSSDPVRLNPTESNPIKPDQTESES